MRLRRVRLVSYAVLPPDPHKETARLPNAASQSGAQNLSGLRVFFRGTLPLLPSKLVVFCDLKRAPSALRPSLVRRYRSRNESPTASGALFVRRDIQLYTGRAAAESALAQSCYDSAGRKEYLARTSRILRGPGCRLYVTQALAPSHIQPNPGGALPTLPTWAK